MNAASPALDSPLSALPSPVIAIDGPSASGKGTVAERVAAALGFHFLDSGALYRLTALSAMKHGVALDDEAGGAGRAGGGAGGVRRGAGGRGGWRCSQCRSPSGGLTGAH